MYNNTTAKMTNNNNNQIKSEVSGISKEGSEEELLRCWGRVFQRDGAAIEKALYPYGDLTLCLDRSRGVRWLTSVEIASRSVSPIYIFFSQTPPRGINMTI